MAKKKIPEVSESVSAQLALSKFKGTHASVSELRTALFLPNNKVSGNSKAVDGQEARTVQTSWGKMSVEGALTQKHKDILDVIFLLTPKDDIRVSPTGEIAIDFSANSVLSYYFKGTTRNTKWLEEMLTDCMRCIVVLQDTHGVRWKFQVASNVGYNPTDGKFKLVFHRNYVSFFQGTTTINYLTVVEKIIKIQDPIVKAIIRFFLTHTRSISLPLSDLDKNEDSKTSLLETIGFRCDSLRSVQRARKTILEHEELLKEFSIEIKLSSQKKRGAQMMLRYTAENDLGIRFAAKAVVAAVTNQDSLLDFESEIEEVKSFYGKQILCEEGEYKTLHMIHKITEKDENEDDSGKTTYALQFEEEEVMIDYCLKFESLPKILEYLKCNTLIQA